MAKFDFMSMPASPFEKPAVLPTFDKLVRAWEKVRDGNTGGYGSGVVGQIVGPGRGWLTPNGKGKTSCSPFTGTVLGMIFSNDDDFPCHPVFNGDEPLPGVFYTMQNGDLPADCRTFLQKYGIDPARWRLDNTLQDSSGAPCWFNLATPIGYCGRDPQSGRTWRSGTPEKMRRGDLLKIEWWSQPFRVKDPKTGQEKIDHVKSGHATFCWDVHLDQDGNVDCFQFLSANGTHEHGGVGVSVVRSTPDSRFVKFDGKQYVKTGRKNFAEILDGKDYPEYAEEYPWYALPDIEPGTIDKTTFRGGPNKRIQIVYRTDFIFAREIKVARLHGIAAPDPYPQPAPTKKTAEPKKHFSGTPQPVSAEKRQTDAKATEKVPHQNAPQVADAPTNFQKVVEHYLQILYDAKWITTSPGKASDINDASTKSALSEFQKKYTKHKEDGIPDKETRDRLEFFAPYAQKQKNIEQQLRRLKDAAKIKADPGKPDGERDDSSTAALKEFQKQNGLEDDGIPGPKTCAALDAAVAALSTPPPSVVKPAPDSPDEAALRKKILEFARKEIGMRCTDLQFDDPNGRVPLYFKVAFGHESKNHYCAAFATYCWKSAGVDFKSSAWVPKLYQLFEHLGRIIPPGGTPKPGDMAFIVLPRVGRSDKKNRDGDYLDTKGNVWPIHVGLVEEVQGTKVTKAIEGNWYPDKPPSGVFETKGDYYSGRICGYGSLVDLSDRSKGTAAPPPQPAAVAPSPPKTKPAPAPHATSKPEAHEPLAPAKPALLWGTTAAASGELVDLRLHVQKLVRDAAQPMVILTDSAGKDLVAEVPAMAIVAALARAVGIVPMEFRDFKHIFIVAPHAANGSKYKARVSVPLQDGTRVSVATEGELVVGEHGCDDCKALRALGDDAAFAEKVRVGGDAKAVALVQRFLVRFGFDLGKTKEHPDGCDGRYGETSARALRFFLREASGDAPVFEGMDPLKPDPKAPVAELLLRKCAEHFTKTWPRPAPPPRKPEPEHDLPEARALPPITSSRIKVAGKDFADWFNHDFQPSRRNVKMGIPNARGEDSYFFENRIVADGFHRVFDHVAVLTGKEETPLAEFIAFFSVFYNEQGGTFIPKAEAHSGDDVSDFKYLFKEYAGGKVSYNRPNNKQKLAGDQLFAKGVIGKDEVAEWNLPTPRCEELLKKNPGLKPHLHECDFYKFQGRGLTQITWREAYEKYVVPALREAGGYQTDLDRITTNELQRAFEDPNVYLRAVYHEWHAGQVGRALPDADDLPPEFFWIGYHIGGTTNYGRRYHLRCIELYREILGAGYTCD